MNGIGQPRVNTTADCNPVTTLQLLRSYYICLQHPQLYVLITSGYNTHIFMSFITSGYNTHNLYVLTTSGYNIYNHYVLTDPIIS